MGDGVWGGPRLWGSYFLRYVWWQGKSALLSVRPGMDHPIGRHCQWRPWQWRSKGWSIPGRPKRADVPWQHTRSTTSGQWSKFPLPTDIPIQKWSLPKWGLSACHMQSNSQLCWHSTQDRNAKHAYALPPDRKMLVNPLHHYPRNAYGVKDQWPSTPARQPTVMSVTHSKAATNQPSSMLYTLLSVYFVVCLQTQQREQPREAWYDQASSQPHSIALCIRFAMLRHSWQRQHHIRTDDCNMPL